MKRIWILPALALVLAGAGSTRAQDAAELERQFVNGMRSRGYSKLALEYLEKLSADPGLDPALKLALPMEMARTRMSLAQESPLDQRQALYARARADLEKYARDNQGRPVEVQANMEIARITAFQGKAQLSRAVRQETLDARVREAGRARDLFEDAGKKLSLAVTSLDAQMLKYKGSTKEEDVKTLEALKRDKLQADFDQAINLLLQSQAYILNPRDAATEKRGLLAQDAQKQLEEIGSRDENNPLCLKAKVWLIPCYLTMSEPDKARDAYKAATRGKADENSLDARMLAEYFQLALLTAPGTKIKKPGDQLRKDAEAWLKNKSLASFGSTPEGYGVFIRFGTDFCFVPSSAADVKHAVEFELANELVAAARATKSKALAAPLYKLAQGYLNELQDTENDLTPKAQGLHLQVFIAMRGGKIDPEQLKTFREFSFLARYNIERYRQAKEEAEQKARLRDVAAALSRALDVADDKVRRPDRIKAIIDLTDVCLNMGDNHRAAIYGEYLARTYPESAEATRAAAWALQAYTRIMSADAELAKKFVGDEVLTDEVLAKIQESNRDHFLALADYVGTQESWQEEPVSQYARYQLALMSLQDKNYVEALPLLSSIKPSFVGYKMARCQAALTALTLARPDATRQSSARVMGFDVLYRTALSEKERKAYEEQALAAIKALPALSSRPEPNVFRLHFAANLEQCKILYREKKFAELDKTAGDLLQLFNKLEGSIKDLDPQIKDGLKLGLETWQKYALVGLADQAYRAGKYDDAIARLGPLVAAVTAKVAAAREAKAKGQDITPIKDFLLQRDILEMAMRTYVQKNNIVDAKKAFDVLQAIATDQELTGIATGIKPTDLLVALVMQLRRQIQELRLKGKEAQVELQDTIERFAGFLDLVTGDLDRQGKRLEGEINKELANIKTLKGQTAKKEDIEKAETNLEGLRHEQRVLMQQIGLLARSYASLDKHKQAAPLFARLKLPPSPSPDELKNYLEAQIYYAQELIKDNQLKEAEKVLSQEALNPDEKKVKLSLDMIFQTLQVKKLRVLLLEAKRDYRKAMAEWTNFQREPRLKGLLGDRNFERMLERLKAKDQQAMQKEINAVGAFDPAKDQKIQVIEGKYRDSQLKIKDHLEKMYQELVKIFFDAYYHKTYCVYKVSETVTKPSVKADWIKAAANLIVRLEKASNQEGWTNIKDQFQLLLENEPALKQKYLELKSESK
jgi:hypothetical protein